MLFWFFSHPYAALVDDSGEVQLHVLKKDFGFSKGDEASALLEFYESCPNPSVPKVSKKRSSKSDSSGSSSSSSSKAKTFTREVG